MASHVAASKPVDARALEARTQVLGRELFALARQEHAHLSTLNRWTSRVLSWCLSDASVKGAVLRFIDVLPSLDRPRDVARHVREYFPTGNLHLPAALRLGSSLATPGLLTQGALAAVIRQLTEQVARQFIAEAHPEEARRAIQELAKRGASCSLDILGEQVLSEPEADRYAAQCLRLLKESASVTAQAGGNGALLTCGPRTNLSVKPSALTPRFDPISPPQSLQRAAARLTPLLQAAGTLGALINFDMEQYELRDLTLVLVQRLLEERQAPGGLGIVLQAYLKDADAAAERLVGWLESRKAALTVRLVKGAYWDFEVAQAELCHWDSPVHTEKAASDLSFERLTRRLLSAHPRVTTAIASHNVRSIAHAMATAEALGLAKTDLEFQLLYGMGDTLHAAIVALGYPVRIYTPIGELIPGMAYLVRRILENTANESFLRQEFLEERSAEQLLQPPSPQAGLPAPRDTDDPLARQAGAAPTEPQAAHGGFRAEPLEDFSTAAAQRRMADALAQARAESGRVHPLLLGGRLVESAEAVVSYNPAHPNAVIGRVARATLEHVDQAVVSAAAAQRHWGRWPVIERIACLRRAAQRLRERRHALAALAVLEVGKPWREADVDIVEAIEYLEYYGAQMLALDEGRPLLQSRFERNAYRYGPRGVAVVIAPWNFPAAILTGMASAALAAGNAVILKPAEQSSVIAALIAQALAGAGMPEGTVQCLPGSGEEIGSALVHHPGTHVVLFTGSKTVGLSIIEACGRVAPGQRFIKHAITEMGGKNAIIVDADADLDAAVAGVLRSAFGYAGQKCSAASRLIVHEAIYDRLLVRLIEATDRLVVGDPADPATDLGPLIDAAAQRRLQDAASHARTAARVAYQYPPERLPKDGHYVGPVIAADVPRDDRLAQHELFGPFLSVFRVRSFGEALALANDTEYALTGGVYSRSPSHIEEAIASFDAGNLYINRPITGAMVGRQPFGGHRLSGLGTKAGGPDYLLQLLLPKTIAANTARHGMPLE